MTQEPYAAFEGEKLILRDRLAIDRTRLANERTLLAYLRSGVALLIAGVSIIHFSRHGWFLAVGVLCLPGGVLTLLFGVARYVRVSRAMSGIGGGAARSDSPADGRGSRVEG